ncbi:hypothetical protein BCU94_08530 [Shewanella sp. 10N.286.52.C2]|uniref:HEAT repeat domain-containing protein n=1 Tax=Shewanella sp. 10N.286.52.C2 TaxID=1880838 RepID=UPI000C833A0D|nr:hypothetical protein [Shewanella sp. 10N.286.52.C2]PMG31467.1 hypothetical protein BCU94_08530 [Shewanella sp. 10N.286.52.C2]
MAEVERELNSIIKIHLQMLQNFPKSKKFKEEDVFSESDIELMEKPFRNIVRGTGDTNNKMLNDISLLDNLLSILKNGKNNPVRFFVANLISQLYITTNEKKIPEKLVSILIEHDIDDNRTVALLYAIPKGSEGLFELGRFLDSNNRNIRESALCAIVKSKSNDVRPLLEKVLCTPRISGEEFLRAIISIGKLGNEDSVKYIKPYLYDKNGDSQIYALGAIKRIMKDKNTDLYIELLSDRRFRSKHNAILAIKQCCGKEGLESVIKRAKSILSGKRSTISHHSDGTTELTDCIDYITSFEQETQVVSFYQYISKKIIKLSDIELNYLKVNNEMAYRTIT